MTRAIMLDSGPLGLVTQRRRKSAEADACRLWLDTRLRNGTRVYVPEIVDYELRRELLRSGKMESITRLDALKATARYLPLTTAAMLHTAEMWAQVRRARLPTGAPDTLDVDVILAAQALTLAIPELVVATTNPGHLRRFIIAEEWQNIKL